MRATFSSLFMKLEGPDLQHPPPHPWIRPCDYFCFIKTYFQHIYVHVQLMQTPIAYCPPSQTVLHVYKVNYAQPAKGNFSGESQGTLFNSLSSWEPSIGPVWLNIIHANTRRLDQTGENNALRDYQDYPSSEETPGIRSHNEQLHQAEPW